MRLIVVAFAVGVAALVFVPIGGASLGSRAVHEISSLWETPANQPALDQAADDAKSIAGSAYYTDARVDDANNAVDVYLANAPQSIIDRLKAQHPGTYVIQNDAAHPLSELLQVEHSLPSQIDGITIAIAYPTSDGYLKVGVEGTEVQTAQTALDSSMGAGIIHVFGGAHPLDFSPYVGGSKN